MKSANKASVIVDSCIVSEFEGVVVKVDNREPDG